MVTLRVAVSSSVSKCRLVMSVIPQGLVMEPVSFNIFVGDSGIKCTFSKFADNITLSGAVDTLEGCYPEEPGQA